MQTIDAASHDKLAPGLSLGELRWTPTRSQVFMFSAVTWNRHQIHFNKDQAIAEGFADVAVQRGLIGNYLASLMTGWSGGRGRLERLQWRVTRSAFPGQELRCRGRVTEVTEGADFILVACALQILNPEGDQIATGDAHVRFASDHTANEKGSE